MHFKNQMRLKVDSQMLQENLFRVVRAFARQQYEIDKFDEKNIEFKV